VSDPIYRRVEAIEDDETLVRRLEEGAADWLAIDDRGRYLFGFPRRSGLIFDSVVVEKHVHPGAVEGRHESS